MTYSGDEIDRYRREQYEKMSREERQRLQDERDEALHRVQTYYEEVWHIQEQIRQQQEWEQYMQCSVKPDPNSERDLSVLLFQLSECPVELDARALGSRFKYATEVLDDIQTVGLHA